MTWIHFGILLDGHNRHVTSEEHKKCMCCFGKALRFDLFIPFFLTVRYNTTGSRLLLRSNFVPIAGYHS